MTVDLFHPELRGVVIGETEICSLDDGFSYRGYDVGELATQGGFLETAYLLLHERLPNGEELSDFRSLMIEAAEPSPSVDAVFAAMPMSVRPLEVLRSAVSVLGHEDWTPSDNTVDSNRGRAIRLIAQMPLLAASCLHGPKDRNFCPERSFSANVFSLLSRRDPSALEERAMETMLILMAEHELNITTFSARVAASTGADIYGAVTAALATMCGPKSLPQPISWIDRMEHLASVEDAEDLVDAMLERDPNPPAFGHPVFTAADPRAVVLERVCEDLAAATENERLEEFADAVERAVWRRTQLPPNVEWPRRRLMRYLGLPDDVSDLLFVCSRVVGWCANAIEQQEEATSYRPRARYRGAVGLDYVPLDGRGRSL